MGLPSPVAVFPLRPAVFDAGQLRLNVRTLRFLVQRPRLVSDPPSAEHVAPLVALRRRERQFPILSLPPLCNRLRKEMEKRRISLRFFFLANHQFESTDRSRRRRLAGPVRRRNWARGWRRRLGLGRRGSRRRRWRWGERRGTARADVAFWGWLRTMTKRKVKRREEVSYYYLFIWNEIDRFLVLRD